jgi:hypothetical protein
MPARSSFPAVAEQIITFNKNLVEILSKINTLSTTTEPTVNLSIIDEDGVLKQYTLPSFTFLKNEIDRLNNNINSIYNIDNSSGALIQTSAGINKFKKVVTVDLNKEPASLNELQIVDTFKSSKNWIFDGLLNPLLSIELDLTGKIENNVRKCLVRRYIVDFSKDEEGNLTQLGQSALNSFNREFRGKKNINIDDFINWHRTTPGLVEPFNPNYDEQVFDLEPNSLLYDGVFSVLKTEEDRLNRKLWYHLNTLDYFVTETNEVRQLSQGDEVMLNAEISNTRYKVIEVSKVESNYRVRFERIEGNQPIPIGTNTIKMYSPVIYTKKIRISIGYNERNVLFVKPINTDNHLVAKNWSLGTAYWTNDLRLSSDGDDNGLTMEQYYIDYVYDYGEILKDLVAKKTPNKLAGIPTPPSLNISNFKVVQINKHLTDTPDANLIKTKHNLMNSLKSEISQINNAIESKNKKDKVLRFTSEAEKKQISLEIESLNKKRESKSKLLASVTREIIDISKKPGITRIEPKFRVRGFWSIPEAVVTRGTLPQEVIQFRIQYRYLSKDGREAPTETYKISDNKGTTQNAAYSNWIEFKTDVRKRVFNSSTGTYTWEIEDIESVDTPNINQLDIPIQPNEKVEIRIKSISEVGWPESPVESDWSEIITIEFPDDLNNVVNENDFILKEATKEELKVRMNQELSARGLDNHLSDTVVINNITYHHDATKIISGFKDANGVSLSLFDYLKSLQDRIISLEDKIKRAKGELEVIVLRNNQEFIVQNGSELSFNVECEDYLERFIGSANTKQVQAGRVYSNNIYVIKDFVLKIRNKSVDSPLGLLSNRTYNANSDIYNASAPQTFWVNDKDELLSSSSTGQTRTQLNNQFIWSVNFESVTDTVVTKLSENINNNFIENNNNSITSVLESNEFNVGYNETSILSFVGNNKSLLDINKWIDTTVSVASTSKLLTTVHPVVPNLEDITETNTEKVKVLNGGDDKSIIIPINIYFKMNALDPSQGGLNYEYIDLNSSKSTIKHIKKLRFFLENESENKPFQFSIKFNINRNKVVLKKVATPINMSIR